MLLPGRTLEAVSVLLVLKAFSAGCSALTGVEAIANGVPLFRQPRQLRAKHTELLLGSILGVLLLGLAVLADRWHIGPRSCPVRKYDSVGDLRVFRASGGRRVFIDQAAQDRIPPDLSCVDVGRGGAGTVTSIVGDALGDALMRTGGVVMRLVFGYDRVQMPAAGDQHPVQYLSAQGADEALAGRVHARRLDSGTQDPGTGGLEHGVERGREVRSAVTDEELDVLEPLV